MKRTRRGRCLQTGLVVAVACILPLGCASGTAGVALSPDQDSNPVPVAPGVETPPGEHLDGPPPPSDSGTQERAAGPGLEVTSASSRGFALDIDLESEPRFRVLSLRDPGTSEVITLPTEPHDPETAASLTANLVFSPDQDRVPEGLQITFKPLTFKPLTWDDLDGWEKTGAVLSYTSSVVGAAYLLYWLFH